MSVTQGISNSFKTELLQAVHDFTVDTFKIALYTTDANINIDTETYTSTGEVSDPLAYTAGGAVLTPTINTDNDVSFVDFSDVTWDTGDSTNITFNTCGAMIYNSSKANRAVAIIDFGVNYDATGSSTFTISFPSNDSNNAIVRLK